MKKLKRIVVGLLIVAMCSQSFAAVVSDNDGSAFITKAEFDSLKEDFQEQIDDYNFSIDAKMDGAIAAYLSGMRMSSTQEVPCLINSMSKLEYGKSDTTFTDFSALNVETNNLYGIEGLWNVAYSNGSNTSTGGPGTALWWNNIARWGPTGTFTRGDKTTTDQANYANHVYTQERKWNNGGTDYFYLMSDTTIEGWHSLLLYTTKLVYAGGAENPVAGPWTIDLSDLIYPKQVAYNMSSGTSNTSGYRGHLYTYQDKKKYDGAMYNASSSYKDVTINTIDDEKKLKFDDPTAYTNNIQKGASGASSTPGAGGTIDQKGDFYFKYIRQQRYTHKQKEWINLSASTILGKPIYKYQGIPLCEKLTKAGSISVKLVFSKVERDSKKPTSCKFMITNCLFEDADNSTVPQFDSTHRNGWLASEDITLTADDTTFETELKLPEILFDGVSINTGVTLYIKCVPDQGAVSVRGLGDTFVYTYDT